MERNRKYQIISDGSCDLGEALARERQIHVVPFYVSLDGETYQKEIKEVGVREFYQSMVDHPKIFPKSSLPSAQDFADVFTEYVRQGKDVLCLCITTKFSGSYNSACSAREIVQEEYPEARIEVIDSAINTVLQGLYALEAARMRDDGIPLEKAVSYLEKIKSTGRIIFTVGNIDYLQHGGRIGKLAGIAAGVLSLKPLIILKDGEIFPAGVARGRKKSMEKVLQLVRQHFEESGEAPADYVFAVGYGYDPEEAKVFQGEFEKMMALSLPKDASADPLLAQIGATIGVHTGPYPIGVGLLKKYDAAD